VVVGRRGVGTRPARLVRGDLRRGRDARELLEVVPVDDRLHVVVARRRAAGVRTVTVTVAGRVVLADAGVTDRVARRVAVAVRVRRDDRGAVGGLGVPLLAADALARERAAVAVLVDDRVAVQVGLARAGRRAQGVTRERRVLW